MIAYDRKVDYNKILSAYHEEFKIKFKKSANAAKAQQLERILRNIKRFNHKMDLLDNKGGVENSLVQQYDEFLNEVNTIMQQTRKHKGIQSQRLFYRAHGSYRMDKFSDADDVFEQEFASLVAAAEKVASGENSSANIYLMGKQNASSSVLNQVLEREMDNTILKITNNISETLGKKYRAEGLTVKQGKTDVKGLNNYMKISKDLPSDISTLVSLLRGHTFSLKNYNSYRKNVLSGKMEYKDLSDLDIEFGHTTLFKAITGALDELGLSNNSQIAFFFRGGNHIQKYKKLRYSANWYPEETQQHWAHMRLVYELRGSGLLDTAGNSAISDFIIWNDPGTENIAVRATDDLIYKLFEGGMNRSGLFNEVKISAKQFLSS